MTDSQPSLKPCPFAHEGKRWKADTPVLVDNLRLGQPRYKVSCWHPECPLHWRHSRQEYNDKSAAIAAWNRRTSPASQQAESNINECPVCHGPTDNGHDRCYPPNPYACTKCEQAAAQGDVERNPHALFFEELWGAYCDMQLDAESMEFVRENGLKFGLLREEKYDPLIHGDGPAYDWGMTKGDPIYFCNKLQAIAALPSHSMEELVELMAQAAADEDNKFCDEIEAARRHIPADYRDIMTAACRALADAGALRVKEGV